MTKSVYQVKIELKGSNPKIWRRILLDPNITLSDLHSIIQTAMGWTNSHLYAFSDRFNNYAPKEFELENTKDSWIIKLNKILIKQKSKIEYSYDFGDSWKHTIVLEKILEPDNDIKLPKCIAGKLNCPPEDCGGLWRYYDMLEILKQPDHEEYEEYIEWLGEEFDPEYFDMDEINEFF